MRTSLLALTFSLLVTTHVFAAGAVVVGTCKSGIHFTTIQAAVTASPAGTTINICPGVYPEQVTISSAMTLIGLSSVSANQGAAVITAPAGGIVQNATSLSSGNPIAAQILVQSNGGSVTINNLTVDGGSSLITGCAPNLIGIYYQNSSGTITHSNVLNQALTPDLNGCQSGLGIFVQSGSGGTSNVTVSSNNVQNYQKNGITANEVGTSAKITGNTVIGQGLTSGAAENSIQIAFGATGVIQANTVGSDDYVDPTTAAAAGILVYASKSVSIVKNNVSNTQLGISVDSQNPGDADGAGITGNTVSMTHAYDGIDACSSHNTISSNIVSGSDEAGIHLDGLCTGASIGNSVTANTINGACAGILSNSASGNTISGNKFYNAGTLVLTGSDACTPPLRPVKRSGPSALKPARP